MAGENLPLHIWPLWPHSPPSHWKHLDTGGDFKSLKQRSNMFGFQGPQLVLISPPRPWYGRPVRPTIKPPRALLSGKLDLEVIAN